MRGGASGRDGLRRYGLGAEVAIAALLLGVPLCLGGAPAWALWPFCALAMAAGTLGALDAWAGGHRLALPPIAWPFLVVAAACALQLLPLPPALLAAVSPRAAELRGFALVPLGLSRWRPVTLEVSGTVRALALALGCAALAVGSARVAASRAARRRLLRVLAGAGALLAAIGLVHRLLDADALFGWYHFHSAQPPLLTPFGNPNHLAGFLTLAGAVALGLAVRTELPGERVVFFAACVLMGTAVGLSLSRAGMAFFALALAGAAALWGLHRPTSAPWVRRFAPLLWCAAALTVIGVVAALWASERIGTELSSADSLEKLRETKVMFWPEIFRAALEFWPLGMGRGAFAVGFSRYQQTLGDYLFSHPENAVLQLWSELGLLVGSGVLALTAWALWRLRSAAADSRLQAAAFAGLCALALHNLFDFSLELPACLGAWVVVAASLSASNDGSRWKPGRRWTFVVPALAAAGLLVLAVAPAGPASAEDELDALLSAGAPAAALHAGALEAIDRHPADFLLYRTVALAEAQARPLEALAFLNRALFLRPLDAGSHRVAARCLLRLGQRDQAFLEYRLASRGLDQNPTLAEAVDATRSTGELVRAVPLTVEALDAASWHLALTRRAPEAIALLREAIPELSPTPESAVLWSRVAALELGEQHPDRALEAIARAHALAPDDVQPLLLQARALRQSGRTGEALKLLDQQIIAHPKAVALSFELVDMHLNDQQPRLALGALERVNPFIRSALDRSAFLQRQARAHEQLGHPSLALDAYRSAARLEPLSPGLHYDLARLYEGLGKPDEAAAEVRAGARLDSAQAQERARAWVTRLEDQAQQLAAEQRRKLDDALRASEPGGEP